MRLLCPWDFQARILVCVAISSSRGIFPTQGCNLRLLNSHIGRRVLYCCWATGEAPERSSRCILYTLSHFSPTVVLLDAVRRGVCLLCWWRTRSGTSLAVHWLRLPTSTAGGGSSIPGGWTCKAKKINKERKKKEKEKKNYTLIN